MLEMKSHNDGNLALEPPPTYQSLAPKQDQNDHSNPPDLTAGFSNLKVDDHNNVQLPTPNECIAHLKLLESFYRLKQKIGAFDGLYDIKNSILDKCKLGNADTAPLLAQLAEKRWAVYVNRAVERFQIWVEKFAVSTSPMSRATMTKEGYADQLAQPEFMKARLKAAGLSVPKLTSTTLPPIDVLLIWHSYMLNPRIYFEDCLLFGRLALWHTNFPWQLVAEAINSETFAYEVTPECSRNFSSLTGREFLNTDDKYTKRVLCPACGSFNYAHWTKCCTSTPSNESEPSRMLTNMLSTGGGWCEPDFAIRCRICKLPGGNINHENLKVSKFVREYRLLYDSCLPGTVLATKGIPFCVGRCFDKTCEDVLSKVDKLVKGGPSLFDSLRSRASSTMKDVRNEIESRLKDRDTVRSVWGRKGLKLYPEARIAIRRMMSRYWDNNSAFGLDLVGAVIRQGSFIEKMHNIDWLHSPALPHTMYRSIKKHGRFVWIMNEGRMAVPTLDVDLAWHTHQLHPYSYLHFMVRYTQRFIDHDDKIAEVQLNEAFAWTSKQYQKKYGEPYSECTCWYCEAVRESHTSAASRLFSTKSSKVNDLVHPTEQEASKNVHISAHNAVRPTDDSKYEVEARRKADQLEMAYEKACKRADAKNRPRPKRDDYYYSDAYGYPIFIPAYSPYVGGLPYTPAIYPVPPGCMALAPGSSGNCCSGTCGGVVAAGGSCSSGGSCATGCGGGAAGCGGGSGGCGGCGGG